MSGTGETVRFARENSMGKPKARPMAPRKPNYSGWKTVKSLELKRRGDGGLCLISAVESSKVRIGDGNEDRVLRKRLIEEEMS